VPALNQEGDSKRKIRSAHSVLADPWVPPERPGAPHPYDLILLPPPPSSVPSR
jgi:hypothetical protein